jgi:branched-chain amino acid transport system substrate-binding protein
MGECILGIIAIRKFGRLQVILTLLLIVACVSPLEIPDPVVLPVPGENLAKSAEAQFHDKSYNNALSIYEDYLSRFPQGTSADIALHRVASIYLYRDDLARSRSAFQRLVNNYPRSPHMVPCGLDVMYAFKNQGNDTEVIRISADILKIADSQEALREVYYVLADIHFKKGAFMEALLFGEMAFENGNPAEKKQIFADMQKVLNPLSTDETTTLVSKIDDQELRGNLLYAAARERFDSHNNKDAEKLLLKLIDDLPRHRAVPTAEHLIAKIHQRTAFRRTLIGCMLPLSGSYEHFGQQALQGIELALKEINSNLEEVQFELLVRDTGSDPQTSAELVRQFDVARVAVVLGPIIASETAGREAQTRSLPIITLTQREGIPEIGDYVFRNFITPRLQMEGLLSYVTGELGLNRFAVLYPDDNYGNTFAELFQRTAEEHGATVNIARTYHPDQSDFSLQIKQLVIPDNENSEMLRDNGNSSSDRLRRHRTTKAAAVDFEALFIPDAAQKVGLIAPQLAFFDIRDVLLLGTNLWHSDDLINLAQRYVQQAIMTDVFNSRSERPAVKNFVASFEKEYSAPPGFIAALAYDTAYITFTVLQDRGVQSRADVKLSLAHLQNFEGVTGWTYFDENGEVHKSLSILQIDGDEFVERDNPRLDRFFSGMDRQNYGFRPLNKN